MDADGTKAKSGDASLSISTGRQEQGQNRYEDQDQDGTYLKAKQIVNQKIQAKGTSLLSLGVPSPPPRIGQRLIYVITSTTPKVDEFRVFFARYGVGVVHVDPYGAVRTRGKTIQQVAQSLTPLATHLLGRYNSSNHGAPRPFWAKAVMWEQMQLIQWDDREKDGAQMDEQQTFIDGERTVARASLIVWYWKMKDTAAVQELQSTGLCHVGTTSKKVASSSAKDDTATAVEVEFYSNDVEGYIDYSKRVRGPKFQKAHVVFGFDDYFVVKATNLSYHEKKLAGYKCSPRDANLSQYVANHVHYKKRRQWSHLSNDTSDGKQEQEQKQKQQQQRTISIGLDDGMACANFIASTPQLQTGIARRLLPCFTTIVNDGAFFRAAVSRREVNYWCPGLNAGIPFVKKKDPIHELTFLAHDLGHFLLPDLVFTGVHTPQLRRVYIIARLLSEATTLVFADMLLAEALRRSGVEYDWTQREIWPLLNATGIDCFSPLNEGDNHDVGVEETLARFKQLLDANALYCLLGDDTGYRKLLGVPTNNDGEKSKEPKVLTQFKTKYMPFS